MLLSLARGERDRDIPNRRGAELLFSRATEFVSGIGPNAEEELLLILDGEGLLRCQYTAYPFPAGVDFVNAASVESLISGLEGSAAFLASHGMVLCYHNNRQEFGKLQGQTILERIYDGVPHLQGEPDTYWVQYGGSDPVEWCECLAGRLPLIHLKDFVINQENRPVFCEVGSGNLDFPRIVQAAEAAGCQWFIVEQDKTPGDPMDSLAESFRYLAENICES
jgi:sugar phosphate isomerase/epimerase